MLNPSLSLNSPRFLITGANGQLGFELQRALAPLGEVIALDRAGCDLSNPDSIRAAVRAAKPDVIFNAGAYTAVDKAESEPSLAHAINAVAPGVIGEEAAKIGALVIHNNSSKEFNLLVNCSYIAVNSSAELKRCFVRILLNAFHFSIMDALSDSFVSN